jgi:GGDEF domain-containing protein
VTTVVVEDLPSPIAWPVVRALPLEHPGPGACAAAVRSFVELAVLRVIAESARAALPFTVESTMRLVMLDEMESEAWLDLYAALEHSGLIELLSLPADLPAAVRDAMTELGTTSLIDWLEQAQHQDSPTIVAAITALTRSARGLSDLPLCYVRSVRPTGDGYEVESRRLVGTAWPMVLRTTHISPPPVEENRLVFWDGDAHAVVVPEWLLRWEEAAATLWLFTGRSMNGQWRYHAWLRYGATPRAHTWVVAQASMPTFLTEAVRTDPALDSSLDPNAQTQILSTAQLNAQMQMLAQSPTPLGQSLASSTPKPPPALPEGGRLAIRVLTGPDLQRYVLLDPGDRVIIGRNAAEATFVLHHHQLSRAHTEVYLDPTGQLWVTDMGSTNGTQLNGRALRPRSAQTAVAGDYVASGPVLLRIEWLTRERRDRIDTILELSKDGDRRDPHTMLLRPPFLAERLPRVLRASFRAGGRASGVPTLWGVYAVIDRLAALHAQHGERIADRVFRDVARVVQYEVDVPGNWVRVGYGELLFPYVGVGEGFARSEADRLVEVVANHPWEPPIDRLSLTVVVGPKQPTESAQDWLKRLRADLRRNRATVPRTRYG